MSESILTDIESKLASDHDGAYKAQLIQKLEEHRDEFATARQALLPPDEYDVAAKMENAVSAAITIVEGIQPGDAKTSQAETDHENIMAGAHMFSI